MKIQFINVPFHVEWLGPASLSAVLKRAGHDTRLSLTTDYESVIKEYHPDVVAFSILTGSHLFYLDIMQKIKKQYPDIFIAVGGPHVTYYNDKRFQDVADYICIGEGDISFVDYANNLQFALDVARTSGHDLLLKEKIHGKFVHDLDSLPFPDRAFLYQYAENYANPIKNFMPTRGCPFNCTYCHNHLAREMYPGPAIRFRDAELAIEEVARVAHAYPLQLAYFQDDVLPIRRDWFEKLMHEYERRIRRVFGVPFHCHMRVEQINHDNLTLLKMAGCNSVTFAVESGVEWIRRDLLNRKMSNEQIQNAADLLHAYNIKFRIENMLGLPDESIHAALETVKLNAKCAPTYGWAGIYQPYPGTKLAGYARDRGVFHDDYDSIPMTFFDRTPLQMPRWWKRQINNLQRLFSIAVAYPWLIPWIKWLIKLPENALFRWAGNWFKQRGYQKLYGRG